MLRNLLAIALVLLGSLLVRPACAAGADDEPVVANKKLSEWAQMLKSDKEENRRRASLTAMKIIGQRLETPKVVPPVIEAARDDASDNVRKAATQTLGELAFYAHDYLDPRNRAEKRKTDVAETMFKSSFEALVEQLRVDKTAEVRQTAAEGLGRLGADAWSAVEPLTNALKDKADPVRASAAEALGRVGTKAHDAAPVLVECLRDKKGDRLVRLYAAFALGRIAPMPPDPAVTALSEALGDAEVPAEVRKTAADALGQLGETAAGGVPALGAALKDKQNLEVRRAAANALGQIGVGAAKALPELRQAVKDEDKFVRCHALRAIGSLGKDGADAVPDLVRCLKEDSNADARVAAIEALGSLGLNVSEATDALTAASRSSQTVIREAALEALRKIEGK
jgi:HEAT repeat protein